MATKKPYPLFNDSVRILRPGGLLLAEDTLFPVINEFEINQWQEEFIAPINKFNEMIVNSPKLESTILTIGDGLTVAIK